MLRPLVLLLMLAMGVMLSEYGRVPNLRNDVASKDGSTRADGLHLSEVRELAGKGGQGLDARLFAGLDAPTGGSLLFDWPSSGWPEPVEPVPEPTAVQQDAVQPVQPPPPAVTETHGDGPEWVRSLVCAEHYTWPCWEAMAVIRCESNFDPNAWNDWSLTPDPYDGVGGLLQISVTDHAALIQMFGGNVFDPVTNLNAGHYLYAESLRVYGYGWRHWAWQCRP